jgi:hypothetical protein
MRGKDSRVHGLAYWLGLAALALQIAFAPALSLRALAMDLDPLAMARLCASETEHGGPASDHAGHCTECCVAACAAHAMPALTPLSEPAFALSPSKIAVVSPAAETPPARGPPTLGFDPTGPPSLV